jgi:hypothetical protein
MDNTIFTSETLLENSRQYVKEMPDGVRWVKMKKNDYHIDSAL